jgi:hypothetical protein
VFRGIVGMTPHDRSVPTVHPMMTHFFYIDEKGDTKPPLRASHVWSIRTKLQLEIAPAISRYSISPSTANYVVTMSWQSASTMWPPDGYTLDRATVRRSARVALIATTLFDRSADGTEQMFDHPDSEVRRLVANRIMRSGLILLPKDGSDASH